MVDDQVVSCEWCGTTIDQAKVRKGGAKRRPRFCKRQHAVEWRPARGDYKKLSQIGNQAQAAVKQETGHAPGYGKRKAAIAQSNREKPRRRKKTG